MLSVKLVVVGGEAKTKELNLKLPTIIGRGRDGVSLTLPHPLVSRKHTELFEEQGKLFVKDLGSLNGTFVNNRRITDQTPLNPNELLTLGTVTFRAVYDLGGQQHQHLAEEVLSDVSVDVLDDCDVKPGVSDTDKSIVVSEVEAAIPAVKVDTPKNARGPLIISKKPALSAKSKPAEASPAPALNGAPEKVASTGAIKRPPTKNEKEKIDFSLQVEGSATPEALKNVEIDLDETAPVPVAADSRLGSFLKKMPR